MEHLTVALNVVIPVFILIILGYLVKRVGFVSEKSFKEVNSLVFRVLLPVLLFNNMRNADLRREISPLTVLYAVSVVLILFTTVFQLLKNWGSDRGRAATVIQGIYRSNFALFGIAITESMYGSGNAAVTGVLVSIIVPVFNVLAVFLFEEAHNGNFQIIKVLCGVIKNPLIIGTFLGLVCNLANISFPGVINQSFMTVGGLATPVSLITLGGCFSFGKISSNRTELFIITLSRLFIIPALVMAISIFLGFRNQELFALYIMAGSPTAVASFAMASEMGGDSDLAGQIVVTTTVFSLFSSIIFISLLSSMGVI